MPANTAAPTSSAPGSFLDVDPITVPGQNFALISIVPNEAKTIFGLKIRGTFGTKEEASHHAQRLSEAEGARFDIYLVDLYRWLQMPPPEVNAIGDVVYADTQLNDLIQDYEKNRAGANTLFEQRKLDVMREGLDKHLQPDEKLPEPEITEVGSLAAQLQEEDPLTARHREGKAPAKAHQ
jgi:hypothetical protein